ncbi:hypothetical protein ACQ88U_37755 [Streptomyces lividans]
MSEDMNHGYRPMGQEYSVSAERPDLNECFALWSDRSDMVPGADRLGQLLQAWAAYRAVLDALVKGSSRAWPATSAVHALPPSAARRICR